MKSRQLIWLLLFSTALNLNSFAISNSNDIESSSSKKIFILIRSEENQFQLEKFKEQINNDLKLQNVIVDITTYKRSEPLPQAKIFKTAYSGNYDVLLLIEQVAKYTIDNRVTNSMIKMGGKYKIRSYNLKETPYTWVDHGDSNCNISVDLSLKAFSDKILKTIDVKKGSIALPIGDIEVVGSTDSEMSEDMAQYYNLVAKIEVQRKKTRMLLYRIQKLRNKLKISSETPQDFAQLIAN